MKIRNILKLLAVAVTLVLPTSCADWLDVKMSDKIMENTLFSTNNGFMTVLNGVYMGMVDVYGEDLSMGIIDVQAQYYYIGSGNHSMKEYAKFMYTEKKFKNSSDMIWTKMYALIANINALLEHCDEEGSALKSNYYPIVKGEALALRAMLHFDLLRLYGPSYNESTKSTITIPYQNEAKRDITPLLSAERVLGLVIGDLEEAAELLKDSDPVFTTGVGNAVTSDDGLERADFTYRQLRLNYFAVQTLLARAYLWKGDKSTAYRIATEEIIKKNQKDEETMIFPWTTEEQVTAEGKNDLLFSSEVFFAVFHSDRTRSYNRYFSQALGMDSRLTFIGSNQANSQIPVFYDDPNNDWRAVLGWDVATKIDTGDDDGGDEGGDDDDKIDESSTLYSLKYADPDRKAELDGTETYLHMVPLIRLSEAYLIAAECAQDVDEALGYLVAIREHRNCHMPITVTSLDAIQELVTNEFAREMMGEGQLFFYYKRLNMEKFLDGSIIGVEYEMLPGNYVWPLPDVEITKRGSTNN